MKITSVEALAFQLPRRRDFKWAGLQKDLGGFVLVRIRTDEGLVGYGEATPLPDWGGDFERHSGETQATVISIVESVLAPRLIGKDPTKVSENHALMNRTAVGHVYAKCAIDIALHDIWGKSLGVPIYKLLGGAVRQGVTVAHMVGIMPDNEAIAEASGAARDGIRALQIKGGEDPNRDIRLIKAIRKELGPDMILRLDANQGYHSVKLAVEVVSALKDAGLSYVEQPTMGISRMTKVANAVPIPVIADESCWNAQDAMDVISAGGIDAISIYLAKAGGIVGAHQVAVLANAAKMPCDVNGSIESSVGNAANVHFALANPSVSMPCVIPVSAPSGTHPCHVGGNYYEDDVIQEPFPFKDGKLLPLDGPGLGISFDEKKLEKFRV